MWEENPNSMDMEIFYTINAISPNMIIVLRECTWTQLVVRQQNKPDKANTDSIIVTAPTKSIAVHPKKSCDNVIIKALSSTNDEGKVIKFDTSSTN